MTNVWKIPGATVEIQDLIEKALDARHRSTKEFALQLAVQFWSGSPLTAANHAVTDTADQFLKWLEADEVDKKE